MQRKGCSALKGSAVWLGGQRRPPRHSVTSVAQARTDAAAAWIAPAIAAPGTHLVLPVSDTTVERLRR